MVWTSQQLVQLATQSANATGRLAQAGQLLNMILNNLSQVCDLELCRGRFDFNLISDNGSGNGQGPYPLPADYWRHTRDGVFFTIDGIPYYLIPYDQSEFDLLPVTPGLANYPTAFYTDISPLTQNPPSNPLMYVWQPSNGVYPVTVRYYKYLPDIVTPETSIVVPWFPNQDYLLTELTGQLLKLTGDMEKAAAYLSDKEGSLGSGAILRKFLQNQASDDEGKAKTVILDRRRFGRGYNRLADTKTIYLTG